MTRKGHRVGFLREGVRLRPWRTQFVVRLGHVYEDRATLVEAIFVPYPAPTNYRYSGVQCS